MIIAIEGIDGAGKSTVIEILAKLLENRFFNSEIKTVRSPGVTVLGKVVYRACHSLQLDVLEKQLLMLAADSALYRMEIEPVLEGEWMDTIVIMDRWNTSSRWAYAPAHGIGRDTLDMLNRINSGFAQPPDAIVLLDVKPETAVRHKEGDVEYLSLVRDRYLEAASRKYWTKLWQVIDTETRDVHVVVNEIYQFILLMEETS